jgi:hypothetical protein
MHVWRSGALGHGPAAVGDPFGLARGRACRRAGDVGDDGRRLAGVDVVVDDVLADAEDDDRRISTESLRRGRVAKGDDER